MFTPPDPLRIRRDPYRREHSIHYYRKLALGYVSMAVYNIQYSVSSIIFFYKIRIRPYELTDAIPSIYYPFTDTFALLFSVRNTI